MDQLNRKPIEICENCQEKEFLNVFTGEDKFHSIGEKFSFLKCNNCGIYLLSPKLPTIEVQEYYPENYMCYLNAIEDEKKFFLKIDRTRGREKRCRQVLSRHKRTGRILDIGCATGIFLDGMKNHGWDCIGIEPNAIAADYAKEHFGLTVFSDYLSNIQLPDNHFDVITLWDVFEHVYDSHQLIEHVYKLLKPGGILMGSMPNGDSWERYIFGKHWVGWEVPRHYRVYTPKTIQEFLKRKNFKDIEVFSFIGRHGVFMISFEIWLKSILVPGWIKI